MSGDRTRVDWLHVYLEPAVDGGPPELILSMPAGYPEGRVAVAESCTALLMADAGLTTVARSALLATILALTGRMPEMPDHVVFADEGPRS